MNKVGRFLVQAARYLWPGAMLVVVLALAMLATHIGGSSVHAAASYPLPSDHKSAAPTFVIPCDGHAGVFDAFFSPTHAASRYQVTYRQIGDGFVWFNPAPLSQVSRFTTLGTSTGDDELFVAPIDDVIPRQTEIRLEAWAEPCSDYQGPLTITNVAVTLLP